MFDSELKARKKADYEGLRLHGLASVQSPVPRAVAVAYEETINAMADALQARRSVLVRGSPYLAQPLVEVLAEQMHWQHSDFYWAKAGEPQIGGFRRNEPDQTIPNPSHELLRDLQRLLRKLAGDHQTAVVVLNFLDLFVDSPGSDRSDLIYLLSSSPEHTLLGFCSEELSLPPSVRDRFAIHTTLPRLRRERIWAMLTYDEVKNTFGANVLSIAHQVALYHAVAGLDAIRFRQLIEGLKQSSANLSTNGAIGKIKSWASPVPLLDSSREPTIFGKAIARLRQEIVEPFGLYAKIQSEDEANGLDLKIPRGVLMTGSAVRQGVLVARWLASQLNAPLFVTNGASLTDAPALINKARSVLPAVLFIQDFEEAMLVDGEPLRIFAVAWHSLSILEPVIVIATVGDVNFIPKSIREHFGAPLNLDEQE